MRTLSSCAVLAVMIVGALSVAPAVAQAAEASSCEAWEAQFQQSLTELPWTEAAEEEQRGLITKCWAEVKASEEREAAEEAQFRALQEREMAEETAEATAQAAEKREHEREERARERRQAHRWQRERREWAHKPTVTKGIALEFSKRLMRKSDFSIWWVDCDGGKINRTHWSCKVSIFYHCLRGRIRVTGVGTKNHRPWFQAKGGRLRQCNP